MVSKPIMLRLPDKAYDAIEAKARKQALPVATLVKSLLVQLLEKESPVLVSKPTAGEHTVHSGDACD